MLKYLYDTFCDMTVIINFSQSLNSILVSENEGLYIYKNMEPIFQKWKKHMIKVLAVNKE